jgi:membrane protease YdiL (CAAX protease family)
VLIGTLSFSIAAAFGVVRFPGLGAGLVSGLLNIGVGTVVSAFVFLGEEIGWRGYLLFRLAEVTSPRVAAVLTGACHAIFHLPLLLLTTTYQSAGQRWIVVPMVMITLTLAGVWYGWLRLSSGSIWPVCLSHSAFNNVMESLAGVAIVSSAATMAYLTTETGVATLLIMVLVAGFLLVRRGADFDKARPRAQHPTMRPTVDAGRSQ